MILMICGILCKLIAVTKKDKKYNGRKGGILRVFDTTVKSVTYSAINVRDSCVCKPPRLPDVFESLNHLPDPGPEDGYHYKSFDHLYRNNETIEHHPSLKQSEAKSSGMPFSPSKQSANNTNTVIQCHKCDKWRLVYSKNALSVEEKSVDTAVFVWM